MTIAKKFRKLRRDPSAFFADSSNPFVARVGAVFNYTPRSRPTRETASNPHNKSNVVDVHDGRARKSLSLTPTKQKAKRDLDHMRSMDPLFGDPTGRIDLWRAYRNTVEASGAFVDERPLLAIYPLGVPELDQERALFYRSEGFNTFFLSIWEFFSADQDLDDIEFSACRNIELVEAVASRIVHIAELRKSAFLILPYDATALTRSIAIKCRGVGLVTVCHFPSYDPVLDLYGKERIATFPITNHVVATERFAEQCKQFLARLPRVHLIPVEHAAAGAPKAFSQKDIEKLRIRFGVGVSENILAVLLPPLQIRMPNEEIERLVSSVVDIALLEAQPTDHLIVLAKWRKRGFAVGETLERLRNKYRKSVVFYHDDISFSSLFAIATRVFASRGLLETERIESLTVSLVSPNELGRSGAAGGGFEDDLRGVEESCDSERDGEIPNMGRFSTYRGLLNLDPQSEAHTLSKVAFGMPEVVLNRILDASGPGLDVIAVPDPITNLPITEGRQKYLLELLNANRRVYGAGSLEDANSAELFIQWGAEPSESKERPEIFRSFLGRPRLYLEDGFIRSQGLWTDPNEPTLSVIMDSRAVYYNSLQPSLLEEILNSDFEFTPAQIERARVVIAEIIRNKISKYNHAPVVDLDFRVEGKRAILIVDQKAGDMSIKYGSATDDSFLKMLKTAMDFGDDVEIIIKQHPCAISGSPDEAHFTVSSLGAAASRDNVHLVAFDVNPYSLINAVDEVWVVSSGMGFEALMAGKKVRCFGVPFYANWGVTQDYVEVPRRQNKRSVEEIFYAFYVMLSRYVDPRTGRLCEVETLVDYFSSMVASRGR